jgi:prepilin-type N-terminal cleavage/methylation domain-containing protein
MIKSRINGFTLVEMLVVIVIVAVMAAIAIPAVTNLMKSGGVNSASREVANTLGLARQLAVTRRIYARVVFPYTSTVSHPDMWYITYAVMTNRNNTVPSGWAYASKWEFLPIGAVFLNLATANGSAGALDDNTSLNNQSPLPFPDSNPGHNGQLAYIEFGPTGIATPLLSGSAPCILAITEGFVNGGTPMPTTSKTSSNTLANLTAISVDSLVGRIQVARP